MPRKRTDPDLFAKVDAHLWGKGTIRLDPVARQWLGITKSDRELWEQAYSATDLDRELAAMLVWCLANPRKGRKKSYESFIARWLSRQQQQASQFSPGTSDVSIEQARRALGM